MIQRCPFLMNLWRDLAGKDEIPVEENPERLTLTEIKIRNCYHPRQIDFDKLADNRMIQGFFRYGELGKQGSLNRAAYLVKKAREYEETGNMECLLDLRNVARAEFVEMTHPKAHFISLDDQQHGERY